MRRPSSLLPLMFSFLFAAACADTATAPEGENSVVTVEDEANASSETDEEEDRTPTTREGSPCDTEGERDCDLDDAIVCQGGIWTFLESCEGEWTCSMTTGTCEEKICERGERRCIDRDTIEFCKPDQTGWLDPQACPGTQICTDGACVGAQCFPGVMFLVDRSTSMQEHWGTLQRSISNVISANDTIRYGLSVFPSDANPDDGLIGQLDGCGIGFEWPNIAMTDDPGTQFYDWFDNNNVRGSTPLEEAVKHMANNSELFWSEDEAGYLVILTDGSDTCTGNEDSCGAYCVAEYLAVHTRALLRKNIKTFVIGYNYESLPIELDAIASNGGTSFDSHVAAGDEQALTGVFQEFLLEIKECQ